MIEAMRLPSNVHPYDDYFSGDPAFVQLADDASDEEREQHAAKIKRARELGDWRELMIEGAKPTKFVIRPLRATQLDWLLDQARRSDDLQVGPAQLAALVFRCVIVSIVGSGIPELDEIKNHSHAHLGKIASPTVIDVLGRKSRAIVEEIAHVAFVKATNPNPL